MERTCFFCNNFMLDKKDYDCGYGICLKNEEFDPFVDEAIENDDFSNCKELYDKYRFEGAREACDDFDPVEIIGLDDDEDNDYNDRDDDDDDDVDNYVIKDKRSGKKYTLDEYVEYRKNEDVSDFISQIESNDKDKVDSALSSLYAYLNFGNESAFIGLFEFYSKLPVAVTIDEVHFRMNILNKLIALSFKFKELEDRLIDVLIDELQKLPSNNTTKQVFVEILKFFNKLPEETISDKLLILLNKKKFSPKMKQKILSVIYQ